MNNLTNIIEAVVFASGEPVPVKYIIEKLGCSLKEVNSSISELLEKYNNESGVVLLTFNGKLQLASNPKLKDKVGEVLQPIVQKEMTRTILECAAIIAYKQPITKPELEDIRQVSCDYAIHTLLEQGMIEPCGRKDVIGKPILYCTTDTFLKRFKLNSIDELPDYDELMAQIAQLKNTALIEDEEDDANYLYKKDEYVEEVAPPKEETKEKVQPLPKTTEDGYELPDFIDGEDEDIIKIG